MVKLLGSLLLALILAAAATAKRTMREIHGMHLQKHIGLPDDLDSYFPWGYGITEGKVEVLTPALHDKVLENKC